MKNPMVVAITFYQQAVSPLLPAACRYSPTCSEYARQAITSFGTARGTWMAARRVLRCHPFGSHGPDPVPEQWPGWWRRTRNEPDAGR